MSDRLDGPHGWAQRVSPERLSFPGQRPEAVATLDFWFIHAPGQGLGWETFSLGVVHLRDIEGCEPARKELPHFTHELMVQSIDPSAGVGPNTPLPWPHLQPHNVSVQFEADDDDQARGIGERVVQAILDGDLPADVQVYVPALNKMMSVVALVDLWRETVRATAEHDRTGGTHDLGRR